MALNNKQTSWRRGKKENFLFLFSFMTLIAYQFYRGAFMNENLLKLCVLALVVFLLLYLVGLWSSNRPRIPFYNHLRWLTMSIFLTLITAWLIKKQDMQYTFAIMSRSEMLLLFFFLLWKWKPSIKSLEKYILVFGVIYILLWLFAMWRLPEITFGVFNDEELSANRGIIQISFVGKGNMILAFFLCLNRFKTAYRWKWFLYASAFFIFIVMQVTRQLIVLPLLIGVVYLLWNKRIICIAVIVAILLGANSFDKVSFSDDTIVGSMVNETERQIESQRSGDEYIRITEYKFFFTEWHDNLTTLIFGTGMPHGESDFGKWYISSVMENQRIFLSDVGYASMFAIQGLMGIFLYLSLYLRAIVRRVSSDLSYAHMWFFFMLFANVGANWYAKPDFIIPSVICLYIIGQNAIRRKRLVIYVGNNRR